MDKRKRWEGKCTFCWGWVWRETSTKLTGLLFLSKNGRIGRGIQLRKSK